MDKSRLISFLTDLKAENDWMRISGYANIADREHKFPYEVSLKDDLAFHVHYQVVEADWDEVEESGSLRIPFQEVDSFADLQQRIHDRMLSVMRNEEECKEE